MWFLREIYLWVMHHQSAPFGLIWTMVTAMAAIGMTLAIRAEAAPTSPKGMAPQTHLIPPGHAGVPIAQYTTGTSRAQGRAMRATPWFSQFRLHFPIGTTAVLLALFLTSYIAMILAGEDFAYYDNAKFTLVTLQGHNISLPIWPTEGRFFPFGDQEFNVIRHFTSSITGYHVFPIAEFLVLCWIILLIFDDELISLSARASILMLVALSPAILISFTGLVFSERNMLFFLVCFMVSVKRFEGSLSTAWAIAAVVCAQIVLYLKDPAFVLLFVFAVSRLIFRCGIVGRSWNFRRLWVPESRLDVGFICLSVCFLILYFSFVGYQGRMDYALDRRVPFTNALLSYTRMDFWPWLLAITLLCRVYLILQHRSAPVLLWDGLAFGAVAYLLACLSLRIVKAYYLAPVDLIAILYIGRLTALSWSEIGQWTKVTITVLGFIIFTQNFVGSSCVIIERKNMIYVKYKIASTVKAQYDRSLSNNLRLFFPFSSGYALGEFAAYLNYREIPVDRAVDDFPPFVHKVRLAKFHSLHARLWTESVLDDGQPDRDEDRFCIHGSFKCELVSEPAAGDLVLVLPTDRASRSEVSVYRDKGQVLLSPTLLVPIPNWLHFLFELWTGQKLPDRWPDGSVTKWM